MKILYFVPALAVLGLFLPGHADGEEDTLQKWINYVDEYRQYMEDYRQWAADRFEYYQNQITELTDQLDSKDARIQELESSIDSKDARIQELEEGSTNHVNNEPETTRPDNPQDTQQEKEESHPTTDKQTYTLGDIIHITGKITPVEAPETKTAKGDIFLPDPHRFFVRITHDELGQRGGINCYNYYHPNHEENNYCTVDFALQNHLSLYGRGYSLDDDGTFSFKLLITDNTPTGEYSLMHYHNLKTTFTIIPLA